MKTPNDVVDATRSEFLRYYDTAYRLSDPGVMAERSALLGHEGVLFGEAFLLPILARLTREAEGWSAPPADAEGGPWWRTSPTREPQRKPNGHRKAAVRALVMFPMNALVEDQLVRLRRYLDSAEARAWF